MYSSTRERAEYMSVPSSKTTNTYESLSMVCPRTAFTRGAASRAVTIGYVTWSSMIFGGWPSQFVSMITCASDMSGRASRGILLIDQIPASTIARVPVKTRKRFSAHHSMIREIMLHASCCIDHQLFACYGASVLLGCDCNLPCAARPKFPTAFINASAFVRAINNSFHGAHPHGRHGWHVEGDRYLCAIDWRTIVVGKFYAEDV